MSKSIKDKILRVLESFADKQVNLGSSAAREIIANKIDARLDSYNPNEHNIYSGDPEMNDLLEIQASWVCMKCGKSTFHVDYDYLVHPKLHLSCVLKEEAKGKDIKEQYLEASEKYFNEYIRIATTDDLSVE